jgi:cytochrome c peroxidase
MTHKVEAGVAVENRLARKAVPTPTGTKGFCSAMVDLKGEKSRVCSIRKIAATGSYSRQGARGRV